MLFVDPGALGGRSKTVVVVAARLEPPNAAETLHALRFGERCRQISDTVGGGATMATALALIESLNKYVAYCMRPACCLVVDVAARV